MARPKKRTVDYFPHQCVHGKTMFIIEQRYGNDGYAFWFKLLELLGSTNDHYLTLNNPADWEFLQAKTRLTGDQCQEILDLLARLEAIDQELWGSERVVWCQNFVSGIADAYKNRRSETPTKPSFYRQKPTSEEGYEGVSTDRKPQTKLNETILNNNIDDHLEDWPKIAQVYTELTGRTETPLDVQEIKEVLEFATPEQIAAVMQDVFRRYKPKYEGDKIRSFSYFRAAIESEIKGGGTGGKSKRDPSKPSAAAKKIFSKTLDDL